MHNFHCKGWAVTAIYFIRLLYTMTYGKKMTMLSAKIVKIYKDCPSLLFLDGQMHHNKPVNFHFYA